MIDRKASLREIQCLRLSQKVVN